MYRQMGESGLTVSTVGLGCNTFADTVNAIDVAPVVYAALDAGVTLFDTADIYGKPAGASEELLGKALHSHREEVIIATKFGMDASGLNGVDWGVRGSRRYIRRAVEGSLRRLGTDYIDLYQMHTPDPFTPIAETMSALAELVQEGKVRYLGSSNFAAWQVVEADWTAVSSARFISAQNAYNLLNRSAEAELFPAAQQYGIGILPFFPLASGLLTGKYHRSQAAPAGSRLARRSPERLQQAKWDTIEALTAFAQARDLTLLEVAIGALANRPPIASVICGAASPTQVAANVAAASWTPTAADWQELDQLTA